MVFSRRGFLAGLSIALWELLRPRLSLSGVEELFPQPLATPPAASPLPFKTIEELLNETIRYDISFLWFSKAASGSLRFMPEAEGYRAELLAETKGIVGFFTAYRKHRYLSHLSVVPGENRLRTTYFERDVTVGKRHERTETRLDYGSQQMTSVFFKEGEEKKRLAEPIPSGLEYEDILSAFYNVRLGRYGPLEKGRKFQLRTIPREGQSVIDVEIATPEEARRRNFLFGGQPSETFLNASIRVPKELFASKTGKVDVLFDETIIPVHGIVRDYVGFGDVVGTRVGSS